MAYPDLPASVLARIELHPIEDIVLALLRDAFPDVAIVSLIAPNPPFPFILARRAPGFGEGSGDPRFIDHAIVEIEVFTADPDGDEKGALISEAVRVAMREAWLNHTNLPGLGSIIDIQLQEPPHRVPDWATSSGPVQFADLPSGTWRYQASYYVSVRKPR